MVKHTGLSRREFLRTMGLGIGGALFANTLPGLVTAAQGNGITFWTHPYGDTVQ